MTGATARTWTLAAVLALAAASADGARLTTSLDAVVAEVETRLASETDAKRKKALQQALKALTGPKAASFAGDVAALKAAAAKLPKLKLDAGDPLFALVDDALGRLRAEANAEISRLYAQVRAQTDDARRAAGLKAAGAAHDALDRAGDEELPLAARVAAVKKTFSTVASGRKRMKVAESVLCDDGGAFAATIFGGRVTPLLAGGEISSKASGEITHVGLIAYTLDPTQFLGYYEFVSLDFAGASFHGVGTYAVTAAGPVKAYYRWDRTQQADATEGTITVTSWDPTSRRVEGTFSFRTVDGGGATTFEATEGTFVVCTLNAFTSQ